MQRKIMKKLLLVMAIVVLCLAMGMTASAEGAIIDSGECGAEGDNVIWTLYDDGELVISGEGDIMDYEDGGRNYPWRAHSDNIERLEICDGVTGIGNFSFSDSIKLVSVNIADSVTRIGDGAFCSCDSLTTVSMSKNLASIEYLAFAYSTKLESISIPDKVTSIGYDAFYGCEGLKTVYIGNNVETIGKTAFGMCYNLLSINIPASVTCIDEDAFLLCVNLTEFAVDQENEFYSSDENGVLFNKDKTVLMQYPLGNTRASYDIPNSVTTIGYFSFAIAPNLKHITIPESVTNIEMAAFYSNIGLTSIEIPASVTTIGEQAFLGCFNITDVSIGNGTMTVGVASLSYMPFLNNMSIKSMDSTFGEMALCANEFYVSGISREDFSDLYLKHLLGINEGTKEELEKYMIYGDGMVFIGTIYCHSGSTAEAYAIENGVDYVLTHFFEGEWTYDYDNMIRYRKCIHCDELETEQLETTGDSDVEIIEPANPDTDFTVDVVEDYVVIEETISNNITTDFEIVKAFDINLKNKDGVHVQPDGTVKVKLPLDWSKDGVYKVYRVNDDGTLTDMNAYREGSHMVFDTDHFSIYVIVDESEKTDTPATPDEPQEETKDSFFSKLIDLIKAFFELIASMFKK